MKKICNRFGISLLTALLLVPALAMPAAALDVKVSGQVNQMVMWADDGIDSNFFVTDNDASSTRFRFTGEEDLGGIRAGFQIELEAQRNPSNKLTIDLNDDDDAAFNVDDRWLNAYFDTRFGKIEIGKGDTAANTTAEMDLSGTAVVTYADVNTSAGGFVWRDSAGNPFRNIGTTAAPVYLTIGNTRTDFDGPLSRSERLRYNSPQFAGAYGAVSVANGGAWDAAVYYAADIYGKLAAAVGYTNMQRQDNYTQYAGSVSWLAPFGLNVTGSYGVRDTPASFNGTGYYLKVGYQWGIHAASVEYGSTSDLQTKGDTSYGYGATYVIKPWKPVELYAAYRMYKLETSSVTDPEDISQIMAGTRIKF